MDDLKRSAVGHRRREVFEELIVIHEEGNKLTKGRSQDRTPPFPFPFLSSLFLSLFPFVNISYFIQLSDVGREGFEEVMGECEALQVDTIANGGRKIPQQVLLEREGDEGREGGEVVGEKRNLILW